MVWQFDKPQAGEGMVQAFRRPNSAVTSMQCRLRGLDAQARYAIENLDRAEKVEMTGAELATTGLMITLTKRRSAAIIVYRRVE